MGDIRVPDLNKVLIAGRLTRDPELKYTAGGRPLCKAGIANTRYYRTQEGERREETTFVDLTIWGKMAEFVGERLKKGRPVLVEGSLRTSEWEDRETGQKRRRTEVNADRVTPLDWDDDRGGGGGGGGGYGGGSQGGGGYDRGGGQGASQGPPQGGGRPAPRVIEEPIPEDDIPF